MEELHNGYTLKINQGGFALSTDSILLASFAKLPRSATVLDLGSGCGTLGMLLCATDPSCRVTGIEIDPAAHKTAKENISDNCLDTRLKSICADLRQIPELVASGSFSCCISNPPYFSAGPASKKSPTARRNDLCSMETLFRSAAWALKFGGDFFLVHRAEQIGQLCGCACSVNLEPKRICLVRHKQDSPISLVLVQCRKGAKPGLVLEELCLFHADGTPTDRYREIYHL